ncbi:hypothetical protein ACP4OV_007382 [Aristida adscensionis]
MCSVAAPLPGSPLFSPSRLPPNLLSFKTAAAAEPQQRSGSPLRPFSSLRAHHRREREASPSPATPCAAANRRNQPPPPAAAAAAAAPRSSSSPLVQRRRPPPLLVPAVATTLDHDVLHAPCTADDAVVAEEGDGFAAYCRKGNGRRRRHMEDRHVAAVGLGGDPNTALFGVFDGHGGKGAAEFAAGNMPRIVSEELRRAGQGGATVEEAVRRGYLRTDDEFRSAPGAAGGACCATALLRDGRLVVSNAGDCRAVLCRAGRAEALTADHRASRRDERDRIEGQGGIVMNCGGTWRVQGSLAVTRGIGDAHLKPWVAAEPETAALPVDAECEFLVLASDGLWDKVDDQEAVDVARPLCGDGGAGRCKSSRQLAAACRRLVELAASRGSTDDISVLVIQMHRFSAMLHG